MIEIADVLADKRLAIDDERDGIFQIGSHREDGFAYGKHRNRARRISARAPQDHWPVRTNPGNGIVNSAGNGALTNEKCVGNAREPLAGVVVLVGDRLAGTVRAGHHEAFGTTRFKQQIVEWGVRQHESELTVAGSNTRQFYLRRREHDGPGNGCEQGLGFRGEIHPLACDLNAPDHDREGLLLTEFARAQSFTACALPASHAR